MHKNKQGFTMIELLVVLVIIAILAAVAAPMVLSNTKRARASEAVATMGMIRQALRDFRVNSNMYFDVAFKDTDGNIQRALPPSSEVNSNGSLKTADKFGVDVDAGIPQYFSNAAFTVDAAGTGTSSLSDTNGLSNLFVDPLAVDFIISVDGSKSIQCSASKTTNCAIKGTDVGALTGGVTTPSAQTYKLEMDNSGRVFISYDNGTTWSSY